MSIPNQSVARSFFAVEGDRCRQLGPRSDTSGESPHPCADHAGWRREPATQKSGAPPTVPHDASGGQTEMHEVDAPPGIASWAEDAPMAQAAPEEPPSGVEARDFGATLGAHPMSGTKATQAARKAAIEEKLDSIAQNKRLEAQDKRRRRQVERRGTRDDSE